MDLNFYKPVQPKVKATYSISSSYDAEADEITLTIKNFKKDFRRSKAVSKDGIKSSNFVVPINHFIDDCTSLKLSGNLVLLA